MNDLIFFLKLHLVEFLIFFLCVAGSVAIYFNIRKDPKGWGIKTPLTYRSYSPMLAPPIIFVVTMFFIKLSSSSGVSYPTGIGIHQDVVIIRGVSESRTKSSDGISETRYLSQVILFNKKDGEKIAQLDVRPMYVHQNKLFADGGAYYQVIDLPTGKVLELLSASDIESQAEAICKEKIYSVDFENVENGFDVRTIKDKHLTYDPIQKVINSTVSSNPFTAMRHHDFESKKFDFFKPEIIAQTQNGVTLLMSYTDLEREHFFVHALDSSGNLLWSKRDSEISSDLEGESFVSDRMENNTVTDHDQLYFANGAHVVCMSLQTGTLRWIVDI